MLAPFLPALTQKQTAPPHRVFQFINQDGSGRLNFTEFLVALWNLCSMDNPGLIHFGWQLFDVHSKGEEEEKFEFWF